MGKVWHEEKLEQKENLVSASYGENLYLLQVLQNPLDHVNALEGFLPVPWKGLSRGRAPRIKLATYLMPVKEKNPLFCDPHMEVRLTKAAGKKM